MEVEVEVQWRFSSRLNNRIRRSACRPRLALGWEMDNIQQVPDPCYRAKLRPPGEGIHCMRELGIGNWESIRCVPSSSIRFASLLIDLTAERGLLDSPSNINNPHNPHNADILSQPSPPKGFITPRLLLRPMMLLLRATLSVPLARPPRRLGRCYCFKSCHCWLVSPGPRDCRSGCCKCSKCICCTA